MDFTPEYILKCEKSKEIQQVRALGQNKGGDWFKLNIPYPNIMIISEADIRKIPRGAIWLPTQDRLQEMVTLDQGSSPFGKLCRFDAFVSNNPVVLQLPSFEQMWLYYVMRWEFGKVWDSKKEEWVTKA